MLKTVLDEGKIRRGIFYFILLYFLFSQWHRLFWKGCGEHLFGDPLNLLWIPALLYGILWILTKRLPLCTPKTTIESLFLVFVAFTALQFLWATNRTEHLSMFILVVQLYFAYWFTLSALSDEKSLEEFFIALMSIQSIQAFVVILISYFNADNYIIRTLLGAIGGSATYLGLSFYLSLSIALPTIASSTKPLLRILSTATVVLVPPALVGSTSRTPAIAGLFCFLITFPFLLKTAKNRLNLIAAYAVAILLSFLLYRAAFQQQPFLLPTEPGYQGYNLSKLSFIDISLGERVLIWAEAKRRWLEAPLLGQGYFKADYFGGYVPLQHNQGLFILCHFGIIGLTIHLLVAALTLAIALKLKKSQKPLFQHLAVATPLFVTMNALHGLTEPTFLYFYRISLLYVFFFAILLFSYRKTLEEIKPHPPEHE